MSRRGLRACWLRFERLLAPQVPAARLGAFRAVVCLVALYDFMLWGNGVLADAAAVSDGSQTRTWTPIFLFELLGVGPVSLTTARTLYAVGFVALVCGALGICARVSCALGAVVFYWWSGLGYSFGKPHHDKVALAIALAALPFARVGAGFAIDALLRPRGHRPTGCQRYVDGMPIRLAMITLAFGYCGAGFAKLLVGGVEWFNGYTLQGIMLTHDGYLSRAIGASPVLCQVQSVGVVFVQAAFPVVLWMPRSRWFFLPMAVLFHLMTWATMDTGPYMRVWLMLLAFVSLEEVPATLLRWLRQGAIAAALTVGGVGSLAALVTYCATQAIPWVWSLTFFAALSLWFGLWARSQQAVPPS